MSINPPTPPISPKRQDHLFEYLKNHPREVIVYVMLVIGILLLFLQPIIGGILIGLVGGIYFSDEIVSYISDWKMGVDAYQFNRHIVCIAVALAFFICAPAIFLGAAIAVCIKLLFLGQNSEKGPKL